MAYYVRNSNGFIVPITDRKQLYYFYPGIEYNIEQVNDIYDISANSPKAITLYPNGIYIFQFLFKNKVYPHLWYAAIGNNRNVDGNNNFLEINGNYSAVAIFYGKKINDEKLSAISNNLIEPIIDNELVDEYPYSYQGSIIYTKEHGFMLNSKDIMNGIIKDTDWLIPNINSGTNYLVINEEGIKRGLRCRIYRALKK